MATVELLDRNQAPEVTGETPEITLGNILAQEVEQFLEEARRDQPAAQRTRAKGSSRSSARTIRRATPSSMWRVPHRAACMTRQNQTAPEVQDNRHTADILILVYSQHDI